jgi:hypothetical protein
MNVVRALTAAAVVVVVFVAAGSTAQALVTPFDTRQLTAAAPTIVVAQVASVSSHWTSGAQSTIVTDVDLRVGEVLKGSAGASLRLRLPGGRVGAAAVLVSDAPQFVAGLTYVIFIDAAGRVVDGSFGAPQVIGGRVPALGDSVGGVAARVAQSTGRDPVVFRSLAAAGETSAAGPRAGSRAGAPLIDDVSPSAAPAGVGAKVTITGSGFGMVQGLGRVLFFASVGRQGLDARIVSWSDTSIECRLPIGSIAGMDAPSSGPVEVVTNDGQTSNDVHFAVIFSFDRAQRAVPTCVYRVDRRFLVRAVAVTAAAQTWNAAGTPFRFVDGGTCDGSRARLGDGHNDIVWTSALPAGYSAVTSTLTVGSCIVETDTKLNASVRWGDASTDSSATDVQTIVLHELGHWMGLRDLYGQGDSAKVMYGVRGAGDTDRSLAPADQAGKRWIYAPTRWDGSPPTTVAQSAVGVSHGYVRLSLKVVDRPYTCGAAAVTVFIKRGKELVPWVSLDGVPTNVWQRPRFACTLPAGTYRFAVSATDLAGNQQVGVTFKTLTVQ